jgi:hypothetical protein
MRSWLLVVLELSLIVNVTPQALAQSQNGCPFSKELALPGENGRVYLYQVAPESKRRFITVGKDLALALLTDGYFVFELPPGKYEAVQVSNDEYAIRPDTEQVTDGDVELQIEGGKEYFLKSITEKKSHFKLASEADAMKELAKTRLLMEVKTYKATFQTVDDLEKDPVFAELAKLSPNADLPFVLKVMRSNPGMKFEQKLNFPTGVASITRQSEASSIELAFAQRGFAVSCRPGSP